MAKTSLKKSKETFSFHLDGGHEINALLLSTIINNMATLVDISGKEIGPDIYIKMNVTAFKDGSFQIDFSAICETAETIFQTLKRTKPTLTFDTATNIINTVKTFFEIKRFLKGEKPTSTQYKENGDVGITNVNNLTLIVNKYEANILKNCRIDQLVTNVARCVTQHNPNGGFSLSSSTTGENKYSAQDTHNMSVSTLFQDDNIINMQCQKITTDLYIKMPDLTGYRQWEMYFQGERIRVNIEDNDFLEKVHNGLTFKAGDYIKCVLQITIELDKNGIPQNNTTKYSVLSVIGGIQHKENGNQLNFNDLN